MSQSCHLIGSPDCPIGQCGLYLYLYLCVSFPGGVSPAFTDSSITGEAAGWQPTIRIEGFTEKENIHVFQQDQFSNEAKDISPTHCPIMVENPLDSTVNGQLSNLTCFCISSHPSQEPSTAHTEHDHLFDFLYATSPLPHIHQHTNTSTHPHTHTLITRSPQRWATG